jgi:hypothetical protein
LEGTPATTSEANRPKYPMRQVRCPTAGRSPDRSLVHYWRSWRLAPGACAVGGRAHGTRADPTDRWCYALELTEPGPPDRAPGRDDGAGGAPGPDPTAPAPLTPRARVCCPAGPRPRPGPATEPGPLAGRGPVANPHRLPTQTSRQPRPGANPDRSPSTTGAKHGPDAPSPAPAQARTRCQNPSPSSSRPSRRYSRAGRDFNWHSEAEPSAEPRGWTFGLEPSGRRKRSRDQRSPGTAPSSSRPLDAGSVAHDE